ncbi:uncharacterized protein J3D65DRAFT_104127 [Phyllosticta citribraziliensis]|uniref:MHYT domain-containing protein n=1 Tax=Phyllosticta citribraziliensis TaxID=989973 RepID=A0ABR1LAX1_9PEZI
MPTRLLKKVDPSKPPAITTKYHIGQRVPFHCDPGIMAASYLVSFVGAVATVELLHRRKSGQGWRNWLQLGACSISFGVVGIWCMHFVGNRAIELGDGKREIQLYYSPSFTALSVFLPVIFLFVGFAFAERYNRTKRSLYLSLGITGIFAGLAIVGMHYIGNFGTTTYKLYNDPRHIIGAALIATFACYVAITLFFHQKEHWINSLPRRLPVAAILAVAVTGMHWTAAAGTRYTLKQYYTGAESGRNNNTIVAIALCIMALLVCFLMMWLTSRRKKHLADRAQHVVLASATFDPDGKILVTQEGILPCQKITRRYNQRSFNDEFNVAHPVFQWIFRVTYNWDCVSDLIGSMRQHLRSVGSLRDVSTPGSRGKPSPSPIKQDDGPAPELDYSIIFREHFCVAASELASSMGTRIQNLGHLWEEILMTGTANGGTKAEKLTSKDDIESAIPAAPPSLFGRGQLLIVTRQLKREDCAGMKAQGFRWATLDQVGDIISRNMQVEKTELRDTVGRLREYTNRGDGLPNSGTWLAFFALRPALKPLSSNWDVLVPRCEPHHLPKVNLSENPPTDAMYDFLRRLDNLSVAECSRIISSGLRTQKTDKIWTDEENEFAATFRQGMDELQTTVPEYFFRQALFSARPLRDSAAGTTRPATLFAFCIIPDVHMSSNRSPSLTYTPLSFFRCRQHIHRGSADHAVLAHSIHREFSEIRLQHHHHLRDVQRKKGLQRVASLSTKMQKSLTGRTTPSHPSTDAILGDDEASIARPQPLRHAGIKSWLSAVAHSSHHHSPNGGSSRRESTVVLGDSASERELVSMDDMLKRRSGSSRASSRDRGLRGGIMVSQDIRIDAGQKKEDSVMELSELGIHSEAGQGYKEEDTFVDELFEWTSAQWRRS